MKPNDVIVLMCATPFVVSLVAIFVAALTAPKGRETPSGFEVESDKQ